MYKFYEYPDHDTPISQPTTSPDFDNIQHYEVIMGSSLHSYLKEDVCLCVDMCVCLCVCVDMCLSVCLSVCLGHSCITCVVYMSMYLCLFHVTLCHLHVHVYAVFCPHWSGITTTQMS